MVPLAVIDAPRVGRPVSSLVSIHLAGAGIHFPTYQTGTTSFTSNLQPPVLIAVKGSDYLVGANTGANPGGDGGSCQVSNALVVKILNGHIVI